MHAKWWLGGLVAGVAVACGTTSTPDRSDAGQHDSGTLSPDGGLLSDGGTADAGPEDAGLPPDAGDTDAGENPDAGETPDAGPQTSDPCGAAGLSVCDDFESATVGGAPSAATWKIEKFQNEGTVEIDGTVSHSGSKSVHVVGNWNGSFRYAMFTTTKPFPASGNSFYTRVFIRSKTAMGDGHSTYFGGYQTDWQRTLRVGFNHFMMDVNLTHPSSEWELQSGDWSNPANGIQFVPEQWHCVEAFFDGTEHEVRVWFEGNEVSRLHTKDWGNNLTHWSPTYQVARFGFETYHGEQAELWYDDVAIGSQRIGCGE